MTAIPFPEEVRDRVTSYIKHQGGKSPDAIIDLVRTSQEKYIAIISSVSDDVAARKPAPDEWSIRELTRHVLDAQTSVTQLVHHLSRGERPPAGGGASRMVEDDGQPLDEYTAQLRDLNTRLLKEIAGMPAEPNLDLKVPHPFFGDLNCKEWAAFQRVHDEDHVQHAQKILAAVGSS
jgi:hypothetical protein